MLFVVPVCSWGFKTVHQSFRHRRHPNEVMAPMTLNRIVPQCVGPWGVGSDLIPAHVQWLRRHNLVNISPATRSPMKPAAMCRQALYYPMLSRTAVSHSEPSNSNSKHLKRHIPQLHAKDPLRTTFVPVAAASARPWN